MKTSTSLPRFIQVSLLLLVFLSPILVSMGSMTSETPPNVAQIAADEPLSIILMIGDGMGYEHVELARLVEVGEFGSLYMQDSDWNTSVVTHSADAAVTDSAAGGTAISTGNKTDNGKVAVDPSNIPLETILEIAQTLNKSTGVVSTCRIVDATPASFMTHTGSRYNYDEIARQIVEEADVDVLLGGGSDYFSSSQISTMITNGYSMVYNRTELASITSGRVFGLFNGYHMDFEYDRGYSLQPSIAEMTNKSIELLSQDTDGFFLMVEGGRIDLAAHDDDQVRNALDTIAFDNAVDIAMDYVSDHNNTILIVTSDHETEGLVVMSHNLNSELPADLVSETDKRALRVERANNVTVDWTATYHTNWPVPFFGYGSVFSELPENIAIDNTNVFRIMKDFYDGVPLSVDEVEPPTTTTTTSTTTTTTTTTDIAPVDPVVATIAFAVTSVGVIAIFIVVRKQ